MPTILIVLVLTIALFVLLMVELLRDTNASIFTATLIFVMIGAILLTGYAGNGRTMETNWDVTAESRELVAVDIDDEHYYLFQDGKEFKYSFIDGKEPGTDEANIFASSVIYTKDKAPKVVIYTTEITQHKQWFFLRNFDEVVYRSQYTFYIPSRDNIFYSYEKTG